MVLFYTLLFLQSSASLCNQLRFMKKTSEVKSVKMFKADSEILTYCEGIRDTNLQFYLPDEFWNCQQIKTTFILRNRYGRVSKPPF